MVSPVWLAHHTIRYEKPAIHTMLSINVTANHFFFSCNIKQHSPNGTLIIIMKYLKERTFDIKIELDKLYRIQIIINYTHVEIPKQKIITLQAIEITKS